MADLTGKSIVGLEYLLALDGEIFPMENGYWTKMEARRVQASDKVPHGIRYSLTLHDWNNTRVLGYDNAHAVKPSRKKFGGSRQRGTIRTESRGLSRMNLSRLHSYLKTSGTKWTGS